VKIVKNKVAPPFKQAEFDIIYGEGISKVGELVDLGVAADLVEKSGSWFSYNDQRIGQGRENAKQFFKENPEIADELEIKIKAHFAPRKKEEEPALEENKSEELLEETA
jgi:recombination protein RecA